MKKDGTATKRKDTRKGDRHKNRTREQVTLAVRTIDENALSIDADINKAREKINWKRRRKAEKSLAAWVRTYCVPTLLYAPVEPTMDDILAEMEAATKDSRPYQILVRRGGCKTTLTECCAAYYIATGRRKFCVVCSINATQAKQILADIARVFTGDTFVEDYPDVGLPISLLDGHTRREQRQGGHSVDYRQTADTVVLPTITDKDGNPVPSSGSCIKSKALSSVRGSKHGTLRPDLVVLDDLQTTESAQSPEQVAKTLSLIRSDVMGLAGRDKAAIILTATTIARDDLTEQLERDKAWKTSKFVAISKWPDEWTKDGHGLWGEYLSILDEEDANDRPHDESRAFYIKHRKAMDAGAEVLYKNRFSQKDGDISAIQRLIHQWREMGAAAFDAEMQMQPPKMEALIEISPKVVLSRVRTGTPRGDVVPSQVFTCAATDINSSYALTTAVCRFDIAKTCFVCDYFVQKCRVDQKLNDTAYTREVYELLTSHVRAVRDLGIRFDAYGIDAGGRQFAAVTTFAKQSPTLCGMSVIPMLGRAGRNWNPNVKTRIRNAINDTVFCRDTSGNVWLAFNADTHREQMHRAWTAETGAPGGLSLFDGGVNHTEFAIQVTNEKLVAKQKTLDGRISYIWKTREPHDLADCVNMCRALASARNISDTSFISSAPDASMPDLVGASPSARVDETADGGICIGCDF